MKKFSYTIADPAGIHARPAGFIVKEASKYGSDVRIDLDGRSADAKKIFSVMSLGAKCGDEITVIISGRDEERAEDGIKSLMAEKL